MKIKLSYKKIQKLLKNNKIQRNFINNNKIIMI